VHHVHAERAWDLMDSAEQQYLKEIPCPVCKSHRLKAVSITREHKCRLSALVSMLLNGHSVEMSKIYRCGNCGYDFREIPKDRS
jgi:DNA-directed RNA polymerase subunit RPC12/RpoP